MEAIKSTVATFLTNASKETRDDTEEYQYSASDAAAEAKDEVKDAAETAKNKTSKAAENVKQSAKETADAAEKKTNEVSQKASNAAENVKQSAKETADAAEKKTNEASANASKAADNVKQSAKETAVAADKKTSEAAAKADNATTSSSTTSKTSGTARSGAKTVDVTVDKEVVEEAPVVHERVHKTIVDENQKVVDRDHDVDHYKKKIQPIAVQENEGTIQQAGKETHQERNVDLEDDKATKAKLASEDAKLKSTKDVDVKHESVQNKDIVNDKEHHHVHERVQPVIEKDVYQKQVNKNTEHIHENVRDKAVVEETEVLPTKKQAEVKK